MSWKLEMDKLQAAIQERVKITGRNQRSPATIVNTALYSVALKAQQRTPKADFGQILVSLNADVNFVINRKGKSVPAKKGNKFVYFGGKYDFNCPQNLTTPLLKLLVLARANISSQGRQTGTSRYNELTAGRWALSKDQLKGGNAKIEQIAEGIVSARLSSSALFKSGWKPAMDILRPYIAANQIVGGTRGERFSYNKNLDRLGTAIVAKDGWRCQGMIENHVGLHGGPLGPKQMANLIYYGSGPLEQALAEERGLMEKKLRKWGDDEADAFNKGMR